MREHKQPLAVIVLVAVVLMGCAVQSKKAPQIDPKTAYALNLEAQVTQANKDYQMLFTDIGNAQRTGTLTAAQVASLNNIGHHLQGLLGEADRLTKVYALNYDAGIASQIGGLLAQIASDLASITSQTPTQGVKK